jgi:broad specificity phosphatase PhoE
MGQLFLVRHGQASLGSHDYDQLSDLGQRQAERLGHYWRERGQQFDAVVIGGLRRHAQTWAAIAKGADYSHEALIRPALNEYDSAALIQCIHDEVLTPPENAAEVKHHFRLLREALQAWVEARIQPKGMPLYAEFSAGIESVLNEVMRHYSHPEAKILLVSSGGPIATAVTQTMRAPAAEFIELNLRIRNTAVTELYYNAKRHALQTYNNLSHLDEDQYKSWRTYA